VPREIDDLLGGAIADPKLVDLHARDTDVFEQRTSIAPITTIPCQSYWSVARACSSGMNTARNTWT
jgi:hypothetical protein